MVVIKRFDHFCEISQQCKQRGSVRSLTCYSLGERVGWSSKFMVSGLHFLGFCIAPSPSLEQFSINHRQCLIKVIFKVQMVGFWPCSTLSPKLLNNFFFFLCMLLTKDAIEVLSVGIDWITLKVIYKVQRGQLLTFFNCLITFLFVLHTAYCGLYWSTVKRWILLHHSKGHF